MSVIVSPPLSIDEIRIKLKRKRRISFVGINSEPIKMYISEGRKTLRIDLTRDQYLTICNDRGI
jgi:hypothetical protein